MANSKYKPSKATLVRPTVERDDKTEIFERLKKNRSTIIIITSILVLVIFYSVSSGVGNRSKYDIYSLNSELNFSNIDTEHADFMRLVANGSELIGNYINNPSELASANLDEILNLYDEMLRVETPEALISIKAACLDMLNIHYRFLVKSKENVENYGFALLPDENENISSSKLKLSAAIAKVIK